MGLITPLLFKSQLRGYYDKYDYRRKRHEINIGAGATSCLTDLGGTDMTIIEINQFKKEIKKITKQGYAFDDEEWFNGMVGISLPITNSKNELCFCLSTHTAKSRKNIDDLKKIYPTMLSAATNLKKALFKD